MKNKEKIKRIDGKYYLVRELETEGDPVRIDGEKLQPIKSIDDDDCQHCCLYDTYNCGEPCVGGFFVRVLPENSKEKDEENLSNVEITGKNLEPEKEETAMELKIGQIFQHNKKWYQCVEGGDGCKNCAFYDKEHSCCDALLPDYDCGVRSDGKDVIFKDLEKVGEPVTVKVRTFQKLTSDNDSCKECVFNVPNKACCKNSYIEGICDDNGFWIEIKQNKENIEEKKLNLKPFDLEAAKSGKPVCTRDGRKARIICFDAKGDKPIIALIEMGTAETPNNYPIDGKAIPTKETPCDLMMLPEKKEGWVNVYKRENEYICENECSVSTGIAVYKSESEAKRNIDKNEIYVNTIKITWEE